MYKIKTRVHRLLSELSGCLNKSSTAVTDIKVRQGKIDFPCDVSAITDNFADYRCGEVWSQDGFDSYALFKLVIDVPELDSDTDCYLRVATNKGGGHNMIRPQMLIMSESDMLQGLDTNHEHIKLNEYSGKKGVAFYVYAYSGMPINSPYGGWVDLDTTDGVRLYVDLQTRDKVLSELCYNLKTPFSHLSHFAEGSYEYTKILNCLNDALSLVDFREPRSEDFYASVRRANEAILSTLYGDTNLCIGKATMVGHTHIDLAWLWRYKHTKDKVLRSFATEVKLLEEYPQHRFMSGQAQLYDFVKEQSPRLYDKIKELIKEGKWEAEGAMWCEPDMNLVSGESIVCQILYGKKFFKEEFGVDCKVLWLPDVFGYTAALPQILKKSGVEYFSTSKLSSNDSHRFPYDTFTWKGIDGSTVLAHCTSYLSGYNPKIEDGEILSGVRNYAQKDINDEILVPFGFADGGGGVSRDQLECIERIKRGLPGMPSVNIGTVRDYFDRLSEKVSDNRRLPTWSGEIYYENHRGTYTSMARMKKKNRKCEFMYSDAQWLWALSNCFSEREFPRAEFDKGMKNMLLNQFHDVLPGTSIREVYEDADLLYAEAFGIGTKICADAIDSFVTQEAEGALTVFNPFCEKASGYVRVGGKLYYAENVPAKGYKTYSLDEIIPSLPIRVNGSIIENQYYIITLSDNGEIEGLYDKKAGRECFVKGERANRLRIFEDKAGILGLGSTVHNEDNWNLEPYYTEREFEMPAPDRMYLLETDDEAVTVRIERSYMSSRIVQDMTVYARSPRIDFKTDIDWKEHSQVLKAEFPIDVNASRAKYEIQFGYIERPTVFNTTWDKSKFEVCGHKWADISDGGYGMALLNDCKYGYSANGSTLSITLLRCGRSPNPDADKEKHSFVYSILPHMGDIKDAVVVKEAYLLNDPLFAIEGKVAREDLPREFSMFECMGAVLDTVKPAEDGDGLVLRFYEPYNRWQKVNLTCGAEIGDAVCVDLMENEIDDKKIEHSGNGLSFEIKPFEIVTVRVRFN